MLHLGAWHGTSPSCWSPISPLRRVQEGDLKSVSIKAFFLLVGELHALVISSPYIQRLPLIEISTEISCKEHQVVWWKPMFLKKDNIQNLRNF